MTSPVRNKLISEAAEALALLAKDAQANHEPDFAETLFRQAADLELSSPELQNCWGGPFNGQSGRLAIVSDLLDRVAPAAIIETGTFRGISTEWLAQRYSGPIFTCESQRHYYLQAERRLSGFGNVTQKMADSRSFLRDLVADLPTNRPVLFYLDAHWYMDLPLKEELDIIFSSPCHAVVLVDDFMVPDDAGYNWDDYGQGKSLEVALLAEVLAADTRVYFPAMPSHQESSARRGCCVIVRDPVIDFDGSNVLRGGSLEDWLRIAASSPPFHSRANAGVGTNVALASAVEERMRNMSLGVASAVADAFLSPIAAGTNAAQDEAWGPFLTDIRRTLAPMRRAADEKARRLEEWLAPLGAQLDDALAAESRRKNDIALFQQQTLEQQRRVEAELGQKDRDVGDLRQKLDKQEQEAADLRRKLEAVTCSRWVRFGQALGVIKLKQHMRS